MKKLEIKNDVLIIDDGQKCWNADLDVIDIACTDGFVINLKFSNGKQAFLHPENKQSREEFDELVKLLTQYSNFYQCDGFVVINLENLQELELKEEKNSWGYYDLNMRFKRMKGGLTSKDLEKQRETMKEILQAKQNYEEMINSTLEK